jgi:hypothetical protein
MNREELTNHLKNLQFDQPSNVKFYKLLWSRLMEEEIPQDDATKIAGIVKYDFSNVPEDNDSLSEFATEYATYAKKVYDNIRKMNGIRDITPLLRYFDVGHLSITSL